MPEETLGSNAEGVITPAGLIQPNALTENSGAACGATAGELSRNDLLPNPFAMHDGTVISSKSEWECRRNEIKQDIERYEIGAKHAHHRPGIGRGRQQLLAPVAGLRDPHRYPDREDRQHQLRAPAGPRCSYQQREPAGR